MTAKGRFKVTHFFNLFLWEACGKQNVSSDLPSVEKKMKKVNSDCTLYGSAFCFSFSFFLQCQWAHIGGSLHSHTTASFRIPNDVFWTVLAANLLYAATPILVALRVYSNPYFFLKIAPFPGQTGLPNSIEKDTKYKDK